MLYFMVKSREEALRNEAIQDLTEAMIAVVDLHRSVLLSAWAQYVEQVQDEYVQAAMQHYYDSSDQKAHVF